MKADQEFEKLYEKIVTLTLDRMNTKPQAEWDRLHSEILKLEAQIKTLKAGGKISEPKLSYDIETPVPAKKVLTTEFSL